MGRKNPKKRKRSGESNKIASENDGDCSANKDSKQTSSPASLTVDNENLEVGSSLLASSEVREELGLKVAYLIKAQEDKPDTSQHVPAPFSPSCLDKYSTRSKSYPLILKLANQTLSKLRKGTPICPRPTPIQLQCWSILNTVSESSGPCEVTRKMIAIAPTGSGKTLAYTIPMVTQCIDFLQQCNTAAPRRYVHGMVLVPTRELAIQVSKVVKQVAKRANKILEKEKEKRGTILSLAIFGGVPKQEQIDALVGKEEDTSNDEYRTALFVTATPGRLGDLLAFTPCVEGQDEGEKCGASNSNDSDEMDIKNRTNSDKVATIRTLFRSNLKAFIIDEADRMASQTDMRQQVDPIIVDLLFKNTPFDNTRMICLYSATLLQRVQSKFEEWLGFPRYVITVNMLRIGRANDPKNMITKSKVTTEGASPDGENIVKKDRVEIIDQKRSTLSNGIDLSTIPPHVNQMLHVCSNHKKPKKLIHTMKKIRAEEGKDTHRRRKGLTIIFLGRIKTLQYISAMFRKEGIPSVELHGQMNQQKRESQLNLFRCGKIPTLLATDVAARGLHVNNVENIINYDFPASLEQVRLALKTR